MEKMTEKQMIIHQVWNELRFIGQDAAVFVDTRIEKEEDIILRLHCKKKQELLLLPEIIDRIMGGDEMEELSLHFIRRSRSKSVIGLTLYMKFSCIEDLQEA